MGAVVSNRRRTPRPSPSTHREAAVFMVRAAMDSGPGHADTSAMIRAVPGFAAKVRDPAVLGAVVGTLAWHHAALLRKVAELDPGFDIDAYFEDWCDPRAALARRLGGQS